ncbi:uncharacterized protein MELLADRAFT_62510 [Melampsora larici-populina 98AG31]|uniref:Uncharacterized protein n=1 Tax=Melampsora larici-populina (strain 98AG31 / pathotype 3-4-7) TaxID=747676 RepID=F4RIE5_MELLP|nr:uncharacterized protein MELLADRAFT_62510 [Melampsora larici-populina 98AG31]EGG07687.1 hypothetical protein MELLADRAFT_62510 [Melampsora larici-populina 98AG31]
MDESFSCIGSQMINAASKPIPQDEHLKFFTMICVECIRALESEDELNQFLSHQEYFNPYGLEIMNSSSYGLLPKIKILKFWAKNMFIYLKSKNIRGAENLISTVNHLVKYDFEEISAKMEEYQEGLVAGKFRLKKPILHGFLTYYAQNTKHKGNIEFIMDPINETCKPGCSMPGIGS